MFKMRLNRKKIGVLLVSKKADSGVGIQAVIEEVVFPLKNQNDSFIHN